jgi:hypothetical protein
MDLFDALFVAGLLLLGAAVGLAWGWIGAIAYIGVVLLIVGLVGAVLRVRG